MPKPYIQIKRNQMCQKLDKMQQEHTIKVFFNFLDDQKKTFTLEVEVFVEFGAHLRLIRENLPTKFLEEPKNLPLF